MKQFGGENARALQIKIAKLDGIASRLVMVTKVKMDPTFGRESIGKLKKAKKELNSHPVYSIPFSVQEIEIALKNTKTQKAAGFDDIYPEFLKFTGRYARR